MSSIQLPGLIDPHDLSTDRQFSMNLARGMQVLRAFSVREPLLGNRELSDRTGLAKPTISRLTYTLTLLGYLSVDAGLKKYRLGSGVLSLSHPLLASMRVRQAARPLMEQLAQKTGCSVNLGLRDRADVVYIDTVRTDSANPYLPDIGSTRPLISSAIGRALILACPTTERTAILNYLRLQDRQNFDDCRSAWEADVKLFAQQGYCHARGDWQKDVHAIAMPVRLPQQDIPVAMNCTLASNRNPNEKLTRDVLPLLQNAVRQLQLLYGMR
jgi:DNA-binding IclR family transcriptional regulator